jgi:mono/diheme cytochrome c family protein
MWRCRKAAATVAGGLLFTLSGFAATPTFNRDIAPVLYDKCATCHRPGQVAPFSLLSYQDAAKRANLIAAVTAKHYMPPWKPEAGYGHFRDERRLTDAQIALIDEWARDGAPEGATQHKPAPPQFASGWQAGKPDAVLTMAEPFHVPGDGSDVFQCFVIPLHLTADQYVKTVEFHPGDSRVVHHALLFLDASGQARRLDATTPEPGYPCFGGPQIQPAGSLGGWAPGATPQPLPPGVAKIVSKTADLVIQIHYHPSGKPETDQSSIGLTFGEAPEKGLAGMILGTRKIDLPPGDAHYEVRDWAIVPEDAQLIGITPHAHLLSKEMKVDAHLPDGKTEPLIWIRDWDFNWQGQYQYAAPVRLPKGTRIEMRYVYDNSSANPHNPSNPPQRVTYGEQTTNEMALLFLQVVLPRPQDVPQFRREFIVNRVDQLLNGAEPAGIGPRMANRLRAAIARFDANHDGTLEPEERAAMLEFLAARIH